MEARDDTIKKIQTAGKVTRIVGLILAILGFVAVGVMSVGAVFSACIPESWLQISVKGEATVEIGSSLGIWDKVLQAIRDKGGSLDSEYGNLVAGEDVLIGTLTLPLLGDLPLTKLIAFALFLGAVQMTIYSVILIFISRFGKVLQTSETPFSPKCIKCLKIVAYVLLVWSIVGGIVGMVSRGWLTGRFMMGFSVDFGMLLLALAFLMVVYIFQYGAKLQKESDETL